MRVILLKDVATVGRRDQIKEVADGYAINFLIARGLAQEASAKNIAEHDKRQKISEITAQAQDAQFQELARKLAEDKISLKVKMNESGHLYESISAKRIANEITKKYKHDIGESAVMLDEPIKGAGEAKIEIKLGRHRATATVEILAS
ncbi:MAG: 50S ribosomal protein L9 [Candidatus Kaiserbacteria bacterium]|nr:50S ribosomal protein L9 [Candidatus Kaiserbacteria bacterium]